MSKSKTELKDTKAFVIMQELAKAQDFTLDIKELEKLTTYNSKVLLGVATSVSYKEYLTYNKAIKQGDTITKNANIVLTQCGLDKLQEVAQANDTNNN